MEVARNLSNYWEPVDIEDKRVAVVSIEPYMSDWDPNAGWMYQMNNLPNVWYSSHQMTRRESWLLHTVSDCPVTAMKQSFSI